MTEVIPTPSGYPILGNVLDIDPEHPHDSLARMASTYGRLSGTNLERVDGLMFHKVQFFVFGCHVIVFSWRTMV